MTLQLTKELDSCQAVPAVRTPGTASIVSVNPKTLAEIKAAVRLVKAGKPGLGADLLRIFENSYILQAFLICLLIEVLQKVKIGANPRIANSGAPLFGTVVGSAIETSLFLPGVIEAIGRALPPITAATGDLMSKIAPLILAAGVK
jgi:hypothetical protein